MFRKREDGLERALWPWCMPALALAVISTWRAGLQGWVNVPVYIGLFLGWTVALIVVWVVLVYLLSLTVDLKKPEREDSPFHRWIVVTTVGLLCCIGRLRIETEGLENLPEGRFLLVGNHRSNYDPIVAIWALRQKGVDIAFVTKPENMKIPLVRVIHKANYLVINREDPRKAIETIQAAADLLRRDVVNVGIYPEGTRSKSVQMMPFHNAVFKIAKRADVPMAVAAIAGTEKIHENAPWRSTKVTLKLCAVLDRAEVAASSTKELGERVWTALEQAARQEMAQG